jgi:hypothetical protein
MIQIGNIIKQKVESPPRLSPKYDALKMNLYLQVDEYVLTESLLNNCDKCNASDPEELYTKLEESIKIKDRQVLADFRNILIETLIDKYWNLYNENPILEISTYVVKEEIRVLLSENLRHLIFKRSANTCTPYGFM